MWTFNVWDVGKVTICALRVCEFGRVPTVLFTELTCAAALCTLASTEDTLTFREETRIERVELFARVMMCALSVREVGSVTISALRD
jgi:hypothetical protein